MKRRDVYINALPAVIWLLLFLCACIFTKLDIGLLYIYMLFVIPLFYGIYNFFVTREVKLLFKLNIISLSSQLVGLLLNGTLHYYFISSDSETPSVVQMFLLVTLIFTLVVDLIAILLKFITHRFRKM